MPVMHFGAAATLAVLASLPGVATHDDGRAPIESLYRANAKYEPQWRPRFLCFPAARDLPRIAVAVLGAEAFLPGFNPTGRRATR